MFHLKEVGKSFTAFAQKVPMNRRYVSSLSFVREPNWKHPWDTIAVVGVKDALVHSNIIPKDHKIIEETTFNSIVSELKPPKEAKGAFSSQWVKSLDLYWGQFLLSHPVTILHLAQISNFACLLNCRISQMVRDIPKGDQTSLVIPLSSSTEAYPAALAIARALPLYSSKTTEKDQRVEVSFLPKEGTVDLDMISKAAEGVREAAKSVDTPAGELNVSQIVEQALNIAQAIPGVHCKVLRGKELESEGMGGLLGVGRAAEDPPALVILSHTPSPSASGPLKTVVGVGKGIVYDTGGLSLKDMAGAAAVLRAFEATAKLNIPVNFHAILCLAENSIGPKSIRPDDILKLSSGKTVEVNNTDAEGRLVLVDGLVYGLKNFRPDFILNLATLTGAQAIATGRRHAAIISNDDHLETTAILAGKNSGDLVSSVADMKNSLISKDNSPSSGAAQFIWEHLGPLMEEKHTPWLHVDMAQPSYHEERATGYGVGLILELLRLLK